MNRLCRPASQCDCSAFQYSPLTQYYCHPAAWRGLVFDLPDPAIQRGRSALQDARMLAKQSLSFRKWILFILSFLSLPIYAANYYSEHAIGWHWYDDPIEVQLSKILPLAPQTTDPIDQMHNAQKNMERALDTAILEPSVPHISTYLRLQNQLSQRSAEFARIWQQVLLAHPELNFSLEHPTESLALQIKQDKQEKTTEATLKAFAQDSGLFFFYKQSCPYCLRFAPLVKAVAEEYGITVIPITLDGGVLPEFPDSKKDQGQAARFGVHQTPALFAVNPRTQQAFPIAYGLISEMTLRKRLVEGALLLSKREIK